MLVYVVRRLIAAVVLLLVVTAATFAIFFLVPRLAGATPEGLASRYVGRTADEATMRAIAERLGFLDPVYVQYGRFLRRLVFGADFTTGPTTVHCPAPCLGYSFLTQNPVLPDILDRLPVTLSLAAGAAVLWLTGGVAIGVLSALRRGTVFDRAAMGVALAGVSLPIFFTGLLSLSIFSYGLGITAPGGSYTPSRTTRCCGPTTCCCRGSRWRSCTPRPTPGSPGPGCSTRWARTSSAPRGPRACPSGPWSSSTGCARRSPRS